MAYNYRDDPILGPGLAYWAAKRGGRSMPSRRDIDPIEISPKILPNLQIIDVIDGGARFRFRLVGTTVVEIYGSDFSGKYPDEMFPDDRLKFVEGVYRTVCETKAPLFCRNRYYTPKNLELVASRIYMPLSDDDWNVHHIFCVLRFEFSSAFDSGVWGDDARIDPSSRVVEPIPIDNLSPPV
jgi:hypothetical protein